MTVWLQIANPGTGAPSRLKWYSYWRRHRELGLRALQPVRKRRPRQVKLLERGQPGECVQVDVKVVRIGRLQQEGGELEKTGSSTYSRTAAGHTGGAPRATGVPGFR